MRKRLLIGMIAVTVLLFFFMPSDGSEPSITEEIEMADGDCYTDTSVGDPVPTYCLVEEKPPDIEVRNDDDQAHTVAVEVLENGTVRYSRTATLASAADSQQRQVFEDVLQNPGNYTIRATVDGDRRESLIWRLDESYLGDGGPTWVVEIDEELTVRHVED